MDASAAKRKRDRVVEHVPRNHNRKRHNQFTGGCAVLGSAAGVDIEQAMPTPDDTTYRILCSGAKIGSVIGRGGSIIKSLRRETNARIKVLPGAEERVILIWSTQQDEDRKKHRDFKESGAGTGDDHVDGEGKKTKDTFPEGGFLCPAQEALFKVHAKIIEEDRSGSDNDESDDAGPHTESEVTVRLLVPNNQIGCLLGKGGKIIEKMRNETGAQIRISSKATLPGCAYPTDELVQISGDSTVVKKALFEVSARIYESPLRDRPQGPAGGMPPPMPPRGGMFSQGNMFPPVNPMYGPGNVGGPLVGGGPPMSGFGGMDSGAPWPLGGHSLASYPPPGLPPMDRQEPGREEDFSVRVLCPNDRIGMVIGKGGNSIRHLRDATGARIKVEDAVPEAEERVIAISATEHLNDHSPVVDAVLKLLVKINDGGDNEGLLTSRLLVPSRQIGCLLGKRGSVITEMRKKTTASLKVLQKADLPKCAQDSDELVQIIGDANVARQALLEVLSRLRCNAFGMELDDYLKSGGAPPFNGPPINDGFAAPPPGLGGRHDVGFSPAPPSAGPRHDIGYRGSMYSLNGYGLQGGQYESNFSSLPPASSLQGSGGGYGGYPDLDTGSYGSRLLGDGSSYGDIPNRTPLSKIVEMTIPGSSASSVLGKGGSNLASIRQISGAKLTVLDPNPITGDRVVEIFGTPEQTQAAQSLLQGFIIQSTGGSSLRGLH